MCLTIESISIRQIGNHFNAKMHQGEISMSQCKGNMLYQFFYQKKRQIPV
jgi:hypothetical protein